ncbi:hypothetical protein FQZ97_984840 [compost metagenome]
MPGRTVGNQRIPAPRAPGFGDPIALQHEVRHPEFAQVLTHGHAGLTCANDKRIYFYFFNRHACVLLKGGLIQVGHGLPPLILISVVLLLRLSVGVGRILFRARSSRNYDFCSRWLGKSCTHRKRGARMAEGCGYRLFNVRRDKLSSVAPLRRPLSRGTVQHRSPDRAARRVPLIEIHLPRTGQA